VDVIEGLSPAISIEQKSTSHNPRSTVGTVTEIHDHLRLLEVAKGLDVRDGHRVGHVERARGLERRRRRRFCRVFNSSPRSSSLWWLPRVRSAR
jgi:hypothetical protein